MKMFNEAGQAVYFNRVMKNGREQFVVKALDGQHIMGRDRQKHSSRTFTELHQAEAFLRGFFFRPLLFSTGKNFICAAFWCLDLELYRLHIKMRWLASLWPAELRKEKGRRASPRWEFRCPFCGYGAKSAALVLAPTLPSTVRLRLSWNCFTAAVVLAPNRPSGSPASNPRAESLACKVALWMAAG